MLEARSDEELRSSLDHIGESLSGLSQEARKESGATP